ncbi:MAG: glucose-6-phosphate isomerase [Lachnospiraceae bacterium]|nr:glucose-6-phosphate isomerase [Lachnospiraceae bacterium]
MSKVSFDYSKTAGVISAKEIENMKPIIETAKATLVNKSGAGSDFLGWIDLPVNYDKEEFARIQAAAAKIASDSEVLIVIGIGGSYLGARAAIEFLSNSFYNNQPKSERKTPEIYYAGNSISGTYLKHLCKLVEGRDFSVNVISKSGTTTEPAIAFRIFKKMLEDRYGKEGAAKRIYATTDKSRGALKKLATEEGYETFVVPDDVGGRFSVLTAVGLLPIAVSGADITKLMEGAASGREAALSLPYEQNDALMYAAVRNILLRKGKSVEITCNYEPSLHYIAEWWKQLFGESEGKDQRGLFPASVDLTTDLHSMGQFIQDGSRIMFETVLCVDTPKEDITIEAEPVDLDGLNYLAGKTMDFVNKSAMNGTVLAHTDGNVPNLMIHIPEENEFFLGQLFYMYEFACGVSGYTLGVNPFDQPGVESYKKNMFALLGKPGYEAEREVLMKRL